jgi:hypothetical protein
VKKSPTIGHVRSWDESEDQMAEPAVPKKPPGAQGLNWRPVVDDYRLKTDRAGAPEPGAADDGTAAPRRAVDEHEDVTTSPVNLRKLQEQLDRNRLDEIAALVLSLTYGEMIELADAIWKAQPEGSGITQENLSALLHRWSKSRPANTPDRP